MAYYTKEEVGGETEADWRAKKDFEINQKEGVERLSDYETACGDQWDLGRTQDYAKASDVEASYVKQVDNKFAGELCEK